MKTLVHFTKKIISRFSHAAQHNKISHDTYRPSYRLASIEQDKAGYYVVIQIIGKSNTFIAKPEELLMDNAVVDLFSPQDVRNLTYLGYLGINNPTYKILAQKFSAENEQTLFAILKKGETQHCAITAADISSSQEIVRGLSQQDAHKIGFIAGIEQAILKRK